MVISIFFLEIRGTQRTIFHENIVNIFAQINNCTRQHSLRRNDVYKYDLLDGVVVWIATAK